MRVLSLLDQIREARKRAKWSVQKLRDESGIDVSRSVLQRKLTGDTPTTAEELECLARALGITIAYAPEAPKRKRAS